MGMRSRFEYAQAEEHWPSERKQALAVAAAHVASECGITRDELAMRIAVGEGGSPFAPDFDHALHAVGCTELED